MSRFRPLWFEQFEQRLLLATRVDASAGFQIEPPGSAVFQVNEGTPSAQVRLELNDLAGQPVTAVQTGEDFFLNAYVADLRSEPQGVFAAYLDLAFDAGRIVPAGNVEFGSVYKNGRDNGGSVPGLLDEVGAFSGSVRPLGAGEFLLFRAPFRAETAGTVSFLAEPATSMPRSIVLLYGEYAPLANEQIDFGWVSLDVLGPQASSPEDAGSPVAGFWDIGNSDPPARSRPNESPEVLASLPGFFQTRINGDSLFAVVTSMPDNAKPVALQENRASDGPTAFELLDLETGLTDGFNFTVRSRSPDPKWRDRELFNKLSVRLPTGRRFSMLDTPDFLLDDYEVRSDNIWAADDRVTGPAGWSPLFHDRQWLTAGLLRIGWTTELGRGKDADVADDDDDEMFDLSLIAYVTGKTTRLLVSAPPRFDGDEDDGDNDEWVASLERAFREVTEVEGTQGTMMALEVDTSPGQKATQREASGEAAPTNSPDNKRAEENPERKAHDDTTPAA